MVGTFGSQLEQARQQQQQSQQLTRTQRKLQVAEQQRQAQPILTEEQQKASTETQRVREIIASWEQTLSGMERKSSGDRERYYRLKNMIAFLKQTIPDVQEGYINSDQAIQGVDRRVEYNERRNEALQKQAEARVEQKKAEAIAKKFGYWTGKIEETGAGQPRVTTFYEKGLPISKNIYKEETSPFDTTLKLGEEKPKEPSVLSGEIVAPLTEKQIGLGEYYSIKSLKQKGFDWLRDLFGGDEQGEVVKLETLTETKVSPTGEKGTAIITKGFTPETAVYTGEFAKYSIKADRLAENIFVDYEKQLSKLDWEKITQKDINIIKESEQAKFKKDIKLAGEEFQTGYEGGMEKVKRGKKWMVESTPLGLIITPARQKYYKLEDEEKLLKGTAKVPTEAEIFEKGFGEFLYYRKKGIPIRMAKELSSEREFARGIYYGGKTAIVEHPKTFAFKTIAWTGAIAGATVLSTYTGGAGGLATAPVVKIAGLGLLGLYGGTIVVRTAMPKTAYERGFTLGTIGMQEIAPMGIGGIAGAYLGMKSIAGIDYAYYKWIKKLPYRSSYKITEMSQLRGEKRFTTISPSGKTAQIKAFKRLDKGYLTPDERVWIKAGGKLKVIGTHATSQRISFTGKKVTLGTEGREINAISLSNKRWSENFFDLFKKQSYSLYSGQAIPTGSLPAGLRVEMQRIKKIPFKYKPKLKIGELSKILGSEINPKYFRQTAYLYEKGTFGTGYVAGLKPEVEAYLKGKGLLKKTAKPSYYTQIAKQSFYQKLEGISRKGFKEYVFRVKKFSIVSPNTWIDKILGKGAGRFKPMKRGRVVPLSRWEALPTGDKNLAKQIRNLLASKPRAEVVDILKQKQVTDVSKAVSSSSEKTPFKISASYPASYTIQLSSLLRYSKIRSPSISYGKSYKYSAPSSLKSTISSILSGKRYGISSAKSYIKESYLSKSPYSYLYEKPYKPIKYYYPKLQKGEKLKEKIIRKYKPTPEIMGLFPDFTARALGLEPEEVSLKNVIKKIGKIQTGFETRIGARIKGFKNIQEKNLLKGIMA